MVAMDRGALAWGTKLQAADSPSATGGHPVSADWTDDDQAAAEAQGWNVFERENGSFTIGAASDVPVFVDDAEASAYVWHSAERGDRLAVKALGFLHARKVPRAA